ncbi:MAG: hypothetical protein KC656_09300, partial [Myxococcales bacterium]|nr:hypothetical protein [Myxococcales bacterium]
MSTILLTLACSADPVTPTAVGTTDPPASTDTPGPTDTSAPPTVESFGWEEPRDVAVAGMATADVCATCHDSAQNASALRDEIGQSVAPYDLWQSSMMANATRDPLWRAVVSAELDATPAASEVIQQTCLRCHAPLASAAHGLTGLDRPTFADLAPGSDMLQLALDGVSCTLCHQIEPDGLGTEASYDGGWTVAGQGVIYGPHADPFAHPMEMHSGYTPVQADHVGRSDLCATCHVVHVDAVEADGTPMGVHAIEQGTGLEWEVSGYAATDTTCQTCHLPTESAQGVPIVTRIAHNPSGQDFPPTSPRSPVGRHILVGGNTLVPQMLR